MSSKQVAEPSRLSWSARLVFSVVAVVAFALGMTGFGELLEKGTAYLQPGAEYARGPLDLVYYSLQLFVLDAAPMQSVRTLPLSLQIARFAAPTATIYLIFLAVQGLLAQRLYQTRIRQTRGHSVLCGPPDTVAQFAEQIRRETGGKTVIVDGDGRLPPGRRQLCVVGDPRQRQVLERAGAHRAREVIVVGPDSIRNAEVAIAVQAVNRKKGSAVFCYAEAQDGELFQMVVGREARPGDVNRLDTFNRHERTVQALLDQLLPWPPSDPRSAVLVIGYGDLGRVLVDRLVQFFSGGSASGDPIPRLCVLDPDVPVEDVERRHADPRGRVSVSARRKDPSWLTSMEDLLVPAADGSHSVPGRVYVCLDDDEAGIAVGKTALHLLAKEETTIVVAVPRSSVLGQLPAGTDIDKDPSGLTPILTIESARLILISVVHIVAHSVYTVAAMRTGMNEQLARAIHEIYLAHMTAHGDTAASNERLQPWDRLPNDLKDFYRELTWNIGHKLAMLGLSAVPAGGSAAGVTLTDDDVERLAKVEHRRWLYERIARGWRHGPVRDNNRKLHPDLLDWEYLPVNSRDKDRSAIRAIPELLAAASLQIVRTK